jgi:dTDP-glucose 4,6-dehydratase
MNSFQKSKSIKVVYVTGCLGFIGSYVTRKLLQLGWFVKGVDKMTYAANPKLLDEFLKFDNFSFVNCDINDLKFLHDCDYFINTAAETHVGNSINNSDDFVRSNINGVHNILKLLNNYREESSKKPTFLHFSTDEVYGDITSGEHSEDQLLHPSNPYSATKAAADQLILAWSRTHKIDYVIVRPTNNYGIGQYVEKLIPKAVKFLNLGRKIPLHDNGSPVRNWLHAEDTANAIEVIIKSSVKNEIINISGGFEQSNMQTAKQILDVWVGGDYNLSDYLDLSYSRKGQDVRYSINDHKLKSLGWVPQKKFSREIEGIVNHYKDNFIW